MRHSLILLFLFALSGSLSAQFTNPDCPGFEDVPQFLIQDQEVGEGATNVCLSMQVIDYNNVESFQFLVSWDPTVLEFVPMSFSDSGALGFPVVSNTSTGVDDGIIFVIYEASGNQETLPDGTAIFEICFDVVGDPGDNANFQVIGGFNANAVEILYGDGCIFNYPFFPLGDVLVGCNALFAKVSPCHSNSGNGSITIEPCGGSAPYMYTLAGPQAGTGTINANGTAVESNLSPGTYTVIVTDDVGATFTETVDIDNTTDLSITLVDQVFPFCANFTNGSIDVTGVGGQVFLGTAEDYDYNWSNGQYTPGIIQLSSGTYTVTVTDFNGCSTTADYSLDVPEIVINATTVPDTCGGGVGELSFEISGGTPILSGGYEVSIFQVPYLNGATFNDVITGLGEGTYEIEVEDSQGCQQERMVIIEDVQQTITSNTTTSNITCFGVCDGSFDMEIMQGGNFMFDPVINQNNEMADVQVVGNNLMASNLCAGTWSVSGSNLATSCPFDTLIVITEPDPLTINVGMTINSDNCDNPNGQIFLTADGGTGTLNYTWSPDVNNTNTYLTAAEGSYTITVVDVNGCTASTFTEVSQEGSAEVSITVEDGIGCNGSTQGTLSALPDGDSPLNYTFVWNNLTLGAEHGTGQTTNVDEGQYEVVMTHLTTGCTATDTVELMSTNDLTFEVMGTDLTCNGSGDGSIEVFNVIGGGGTYTVEWDGYPDQDGLILTGADAGNIEFTVMDMQGCSVDSSFQLNQPLSINLDIDFSQYTFPSCSNSNDGMIAISDLNFEPGDLYTYDWPDPIADQVGVESGFASGFGNGTYEVIVTDQNNCSSSLMFFMTAPDPVEFDGNASIIVAPVCVGQCDGFVELAVIGGTPSDTNFEYFIEWEDGSDSFERDNLCPGFYTVTVTDGNDCMTELNLDFDLVGDTLTLEIDSLLTSTISCNSEEGGQIVVLAEGGTGDVSNYRYDWTEGVESTTSIANNLDGGLYEITVTDLNGCTASTFFEMNAAPPIDIAFFDPVTADCAGGTTCLEIGIPSGGSGAPYFYQLNNQPPVLPIDSCITVFAGLYNLTIIDSDNCLLDTFIEVFEPSIPSVDLGGNLEVELGDTDVIIDADFQGDELIDSIQWMTLDSINCLDVECEEIALSITQDQVISVVVTDSNGCTAADQISVTVNEVRNVFLPTVFMPDLDTERTFMVHLGQGAEMINYLAVFDRWGNQVYQVDNVLADDTAMHGWTGRFNNNDAVEGVYVYIVEVLFSDGQVRRFTRDITLLR